MASATEAEIFMGRFNPDRPIHGAAAPERHKPGGGARVLTLLLRAAVMAAALSLFLLLAGAAALALLHLLVAARHRPLRRPPPPPSPGYACLSSWDIRALPSFRYPDAAAAAEDCPVCLEGFRLGDRCRALPGCGHVFHKHCVDRWLERRPACPVCRGPVEPPGPRSRWY